MRTGKKLIGIAALLFVVFAVMTASTASGQTTSGECEAMFADLPPDQRNLICSGYASANSDGVGARQNADNCPPGSIRGQNAASPGGTDCVVNDSNPRSVEIYLQHTADSANRRNSPGCPNGTWSWYRFTPDFATLVCM
ncbi:MAG: hypothetical protein F4124_10565 [Acidimicrobiia bacterium]|nr:hypothetical protein [Acidimicrobiia bacterium]MYB72890.1 hypothetical protein [Acidimicrobiia bacterium]MYH99859.1 hypothetical protein [Acidimicrobiia bacterium]